MTDIRLCCFLMQKKHMRWLSQFPYTIRACWVCLGASEQHLLWAGRDVCTILIVASTICPSYFLDLFPSPFSAMKYVDLSESSDADVGMDDSGGVDADLDGYRRDADLWRITLCPRMRDCRVPDCHHAHSLVEVRPPNESQCLYPSVWAAGISRFYGQRMSADQYDLFLGYYYNTFEHEIPLWAHGCLLRDRRRGLAG